MVHEATKSPPWTQLSIQKTRRKTEGQQRQQEKKYIDIISLIVVNIYAYQLFQLLKHNLHKYVLSNRFAFVLFVLFGKGRGRAIQ